MAIAEVRCQQVLLIFDVGPRSAPPLECDCVQCIDINGSIELEVVDGGLLAIPPEGVDIFTNG